MSAPVFLLSGGRDGCPNYCRAVEAAGGLPCPVYCPTGGQTDPNRWDGLVLSGGGDLVPSYYGQPWNGTRTIDPVRDEAELSLIRRFLEAGKPILAICRGFQLVNVVCGGDLLQAMEAPLCAHHDQLLHQDRHHSTTLLPGSYLHWLYGDRVLVNSAHHQAVTQLGSGLIGCQWAADGILEGFYHADLPVFGVQWHPERCIPSGPEDPLADGQRLFSFFVSQCQM